MSSLACCICQIYQLPKEDRGFYGLLNLSKFIKYQRRFAVCWICPISNQSQRGIEDVFSSTHLSVTSHASSVSSYKCKDFESIETASHTSPPRMLKGLTDLKAKEGIPCLVDGTFSCFRRIHQSTYQKKDFDIEANLNKRRSTMPGDGSFSPKTQGLCKLGRCAENQNGNF